MFSLRHRVQEWPAKRQQWLLRVALYASALFGVLVGPLLPHDVNLIVDGVAIGIVMSWGADAINRRRG